MIGKTLGHYRIDRLLGKGGMGEVYVAHDTKLRRDVALKILPPQLAADAERRHRFEREAHAVAALNHPNIVTIFSVDTVDNVPFLTMELVDGRLLSDIIPEQGFATERFLDLAIPLSDALAAAHEKGVTHRDVKPGNVMVDSAGRLKVLDFGLAKLLDSASDDQAMTMATAPAHETAEGRILGTAYYMAPEQAEGRPADPRSDVFSLGVLLYEMLTGKRPFEGATSISVLSSILKDTPPSVHEVRETLPRHLGRIVNRCLAKDPERRYQNAKELRNELEALKAEMDTGEHAPRPAGASRHASSEASEDAVPSRLSAATSPQGPDRGPGRSLNRSGPRIPGPAIFGIGLAIIAVFVGLAILAFRNTESAPNTAIVTTGESGESGDPGETGDPEESGDPGETSKTSKTPTIGVMGFENLADRDDPQQLGRMLTGLITTYLTETGGLEVISMSRVLASLREVSPENETAFDSALAPEAAEKAGADRMLVGQIGRAGEQILLTAELVDVATGRTIATQRHEAASQRELFDLAQVIAEDIRDQLGTGRTDSGGLDLEKALTASPAAYRHYVAGEIALNQRRWQDATGHFRQAVEEDPTFALAYYRMAMAEWWYGDYTEATRVLDEGQPYVARLPERWQRMVEAMGHYLSERHQDAFVILNDLVEQHPDLTDAWYMLGEVHTHDVEYANRVRALECFRKVIELDPSFTVVFFHLIDFLVDAGEFEEADRLLGRFRDTAPDDPAYVVSAMSLFLGQGRIQEAVEFGEAALAAGTLESPARLVIALGNLDRWERALEVLDSTMEEEVGFNRGLHLALRSQVLTGMGRIREARNDAEGGIALLIQHGGPGIVAAGHRLALIRLHQLTGATELAIREARQTLGEVPDHFATYYHLIDVLREAGRADEAAAVLADLEARVEQSRNPAAPYWLTLTHALQAMHEGQPSRALSLLNEARRRPQIIRRRLHESILEARIQEAAGDPAKAAAAYREARDPSIASWSGLSRRVILLYPLARAEEAAGEYAGAREHYQELLDRWGSVDVDLPRMEDARRRLAELEKAR